MKSILRRWTSKWIFLASRGSCLTRRSFWPKKFSRKLATPETSIESVRSIRIIFILLEELLIMIRLGQICF